MIYSRRTFIKRLLALWGGAASAALYAKSTSQGVVKLTTLKIAGLQYGACAETRFKQHEHLELRREPNNPHDKYAVAIYKQGKKTGYIPRTNSRIVASLMDNGHRLHATVRYYRPNKEPWERVWVSVWMDA